MAVKRKSEVGDRWTHRLAELGFTPVVDIFLERYARLRPHITTPEAMLVIQLMKHKWDDKMPRPSFRTLAKRMGVTPTAVRNHARSLEAKKYLNRRMRVGRPNWFDLSPLFHALEKEIPAFKKDKKMEEPEPQYPQAIQAEAPKPESKAPAKRRSTSIKQRRPKRSKISGELPRAS